MITQNLHEETLNRKIEQFAKSNKDITLDLIRSFLDEEMSRLKNRDDFGFDNRVQKVYQDLSIFRDKIVPYIRNDIENRVDSIIQLHDSGEIKLDDESWRKLMKLFLG